MNNNSESHNLEELLAGYVLGNLEEEELTWLNKQLTINNELREQVKQLEATLNLIPYGLPEDVPQTDLRSKILVKAQFQPSTSSKFNRLGWIISAITTLSTLWLAIMGYSWRQQLLLTNSQLQQQQELIALLRQPNNRLVSLKGLDELPTASGSLFIASESQKAILAIQNLEPLSGKQVYRLWAVFPDKKTGCVNFTPDEKGVVHLEFSNEALIDAQSILITIEPEPDTLQPKGNPIIINSHSL